MAGININKKATETNLSSKTKPADEVGITGRIVPGVPTTRVYTGVETDTAKVKVDNRNKTIAVEVKDWSHGDFSFEDNTIAIKNPETGNYEPVIGPVEVSLETTPGHVFNNTENTIYLAGDTERPIYVTEVDGKNIYSEIALLSDSGGSVIYAATVYDFPKLGAGDKLYVAVDENNTYFWNGKCYKLAGVDSREIDAGGADADASYNRGIKSSL